METQAKRKRNGPATREAILEAARRAFGEVGYEGAGLREIAGRAGVHPSLVNRYFGAKQRLFEQAVPDAFAVAPFLPDDREGFATHLAETVLGRGGCDADTTLAMVRSSGSPEAARMLRAGIEERFVGPLADWLGGPDARTRAALVMSLLAGMALMRDVFEVEAVSDRSEALSRLLADLLALLVEPVAADDGPAGR